MTDFKKGGPLQNSNIYATNRLFVKNPLFKKRKKKKAPGVYNPTAKFKYKDGGENKTKLTKEEEKQFQKFYKTLPENLQLDDNTYDIRGYWDGLGRPQEFDYTQPTESDGYYHAFSINPNTGEYLKSPAHDTFQHAVDEDRKIGYRPLTNVYGRNVAVENESIADPEAQTFLRNTQGPVSYKNGGSIVDITEEEIQKYIDGGYVVEEVNDPSIPALTKAAKGGASKGCKDGEYWDGTKCTKLITLKNDKKYIDGVANWAMHVSDPNKISSDYNDQIKDRLYSGKWGFDPQTGALVKLSAVQPKSVTTVDAKTKASREKEKLVEKNYRAEEENKKAYEQSIIGAGFDPATFGKAKGVNTITGEPIYASSKEEADKINQEAINQAAIEGHAAVVNNPVFKAGAYMTPVGMAIGAMEGLARFVPDAATFAQDPTLANAGQLGTDVAQLLPFAKPIANTFKINPKIKSNTAFYKSKNTGTNTSTGLTDADIAAARAEEEAWLTSDEYLKRRMKNTGESAKAVREDVAKILKRADKANYNVNADLKGAHGEMATNIFINPKVSVSKTAPNPKKVLRHENIHLYSPASKNKSILGTDLHKGWDNPNVAELKASERGVYANYPTIGDSPESIMYADPSDYHYNMLGYEQQARHLGAMRDIAAKNNVDIKAGKKLTEQQVRSHIDDFIKNRENVDYDYDEIWGAEILNERKKLADAYGAPLDEIKKIDPDKYKEIINVSKDNAAKTITKVLNNAWVVAPTVGVAGTATMLANPFQGSNGLQQQKKGGATDDYIELDIPEEEIQWYIDNGYRVEPVTKLKKFIG